MTAIEVNGDNMAFFECLSSATRVKIIELLNDRSLNIGELAELLGVSSAIVTKHIQKMEQAGIVATESATGKRGMQKVCSLQLDSVQLMFRQSKPAAQRSYAASIPLGQYIAWDIKPTCGMVSEQKLIGMLDDPRYFADPERVQARHIWFGSGYVEYRLPNFLLSNQSLKRLEIALEVASEAPGYNEQWPSDITFSINGIELATWTSPGDFGSKKGVYTPQHFNFGSQYGLLKTLSVTEEGTFIDGVYVSPVTIGQIGIAFGKDVLFRIACHEAAEHCGGVSLYGRGYGNYDQDIEVKMFY
ncbi:ArsR/SmtB family transcription factor [Paenibacillus sp. GCM10027626]|uniref:ArsR/SmtB family transcription factor n=1 Tax=Paenibacillus sp. GCM10027626 TaxID=3273411 RepID=UPI00362794B2